MLKALIQRRGFLTSNSCKIQNGILRLPEPLSTDCHGRVTIYDSFRGCVKNKPGIPGTLLWCFSGSMLCVPSIDFKLSFICFAAISSYSVLQAFSQRVSISRIQLLEDGQQVLIYDAMGNTEIVPIAGIKMEKYTENKNLLELTFSGQTK